MLTKEFLTLEESIPFIKNNHIVSPDEWLLYVSCTANDVTYYNVKFQPCEPLPKNIKYNVPELLKNEKIPYPFKYKNIKYGSYEMVKGFIKQFNLTSYKDWLEFLMWFRKDKKPILDFIPIVPEHYYKKSKAWWSWSDFLNIKAKDVKKLSINDSNRFYLAYDDAKIFASSLRLSNMTEWDAYELYGEGFKNKKGDILPKKPITIPRYVEQFYKENNTWISWQDFLGYKSNPSYSFYDLKYIAKINNIRTKRKWERFAVENGYPPNILSNYRKECPSWNHFFDKVNLEYSSLEDIKQFLYNKNFKTIEEYKAWWDIEKPKNLPKFIDIWLAKNDKDYKVKKYFNLGVNNKLELEDFRKVLYICYDDLNIRNLISVSIDVNGKTSAMMNISKKHQKLIAMYIIEDGVGIVESIKEIVGKYCIKYSGGYQNQWLTMNIDGMLEMFDRRFEKV